MQNRTGKRRKKGIKTVGQQTQFDVFILLNSKERERSARKGKHVILFCYVHFVVLENCFSHKISHADWLRMLQLFESIEIEWIHFLFLIILFCLLNFFRSEKSWSAVVRRSQLKWEIEGLRFINLWSVCFELNGF